MKNFIFSDESQNVLEEAKWESLFEEAYKSEKVEDLATKMQDILAMCSTIDQQIEAAKNLESTWRHLRSYGPNYLTILEEAKDAGYAATNFYVTLDQLDNPENGKEFPPPFKSPDGYKWVDGGDENNQDYNYWALKKTE